MSRMLQALKELERRQAQAALQPAAGLQDDGGFAEVAQTRAETVASAPAPSDFAPIGSFSEILRTDAPASPLVSQLQVARSFDDVPAETGVDSELPSADRQETFNLPIQAFDGRLSDADRSTDSGPLALVDLAGDLLDTLDDLDRTPVQIPRADSAEEAEIAEAMEPPAVLMMPRGPRPILDIGLATEVEPAYRDLCERIVAQRSAATTSILLFIGVAELGESQFSLLKLAAAFCEPDANRVLLIDAAGKMSRLCEPAQTDSLPSLTDVLHARADWRDAIRETTASRLDLVVSGPPSYPELKTRDAGLWNPIRNDYPFVLIDAGPAAGPAATALAPICDAAYLIVALGETERGQAVRVLDVLRGKGANILGCIVTNAHIGS